MSQALHIITGLPDAPLDAAAAYFANHHAEACALLEEDETNSLVILLDKAGADHDAWRRALAGDMARCYAPKRCSLVGAASLDDAKATLAYLESAEGVTGQYLAGHE